MTETHLYQRLEQQRFANGYELVNGVAMHSIHREELVLGMDATDFKVLAAWLAAQRQ